MVRIQKHRGGFHRLILCVALMLLAGSFSRTFGHELEPADLVILNGKILTEDAKQPEAEAIAIRKDTVIAVGSNEAMRAYIGKSTRTMDIGGMLAVPGFIEGHGHLLLLGQSKMELDLTKARNWDGIVSIVQDSARKAGPGAWILGSGWHQEKWDKTPSPGIEGYPTDDTLNKASPGNPVLLTHARRMEVLQGHAAKAFLYNSGYAIEELRKEWKKIFQRINLKSETLSLRTTMTSEVSWKRLMHKWADPGKKRNF